MPISGMKRYITRTIALLNIVCLISLMFVGCGDTDISNGAYRKVSAIDVDSQIIASNYDYELLWDNEANAVLLKSLKTGKMWSDILYSAFKEGSTSANANSQIIVNVVNVKNFKQDSIRSYSEIQNGNGNIVCKKIDNGIRITYFFDTYEIAIPVDYVLKEKSISVSINTAQILESGNNYKLLSVSLAPYLCSAQNNVENSYLFIPTGSGALMYAKSTPDGVKTYSGEVYGADAARQIPRDLVDEEDICLPVFGAVESNSAMMCVIEQGAGAANIEAQAGNDRLGYSNANVSFYVRGYDEFLYDKQDGTKKELTTRIGNNISGQTLSVAYYPLYEDDASYVGIAKKYREYLIENSGLKKEDAVGSPYSITLLGGTNITKSILGIPKHETVAMTTFEQSKNILEDIDNKNGVLPTVRMLGFGDKGVMPGTIAGGKKYSSIYGNKKQLKSLQKFCEEKGISIYFDSDIVYFSKSILGFSRNFDSALTVINKRITHYPVSPIKIQDKDSGYSVISRNKLDEAAEIVLEKAEKYNHLGISLSSLGTTAFSDNADKIYHTKNGIESDVAKIINKFSSNGIKTAVASANAYAAAVANVIFDVSVTNGDYMVFDETVPFYQIVFHGYKSMYTEGLNLSANYKKALAQSVAYGMGLGYTLINSYISESDELGISEFYGMLYEDNSDLIHNTICESDYCKIYSSTYDSDISGFRWLSNGVSETSYSNGVLVYTNHTDAEAESPVGILNAYEFAME